MKNLFIATVLALVIGFVFGWKIEAWRSNSKFAALQSSIDSKTTQALLDLQTKMQDADNKVVNLTKSLIEVNSKNEKLENDRDAAIASGIKRVYVRANCPPPNSSTTNTPTAAGGNGSTAELDPAYRQTLSELRRAAEQQYEQITTLQNYAQMCFMP